MKITSTEKCVKIMHNRHGDWMEYGKMCEKWDSWHKRRKIMENCMD